jgi:hypothetical protein
MLRVAAPGDDSPGAVASLIRVSESFRSDHEPFRRLGEMCA